MFDISTHVRNAGVTVRTGWRGCQWVARTTVSALSKPLGKGPTKPSHLALSTGRERNLVFPVMDYRHPCRRHLNGALACPGCGTPVETLRAHPEASAAPQTAYEGRTGTGTGAARGAGTRRRHTAVGRRRRCPHGTGNGRRGAGAGRAAGTARPWRTAGDGAERC
ncbi:SCO2400 family protein [Streptomyces sp. INA 01156]